MMEKGYRPMEFFWESPQQWKLLVKNPAPLVFSGVGFLQEQAKRLCIVYHPFFQPGDFIANETGLFQLSGSLGPLLSFRQDLVPWLGHVLFFATTLYRMRETVRHYNQNTSIIFRGIIPEGPLKGALLEAMGDTGCFFWSPEFPDGILHIELWKQLGGIPRAVERTRLKLAPNLKLLVEINNLSDGITAMKHGADGVVLRGLRGEVTSEVTRALRERFKKAYIEYCGPVGLSNIDSFASAGLDAISPDNIPRLLGLTQLETVLELLPENAGEQLQPGAEE